MDEAQEQQRLIDEQGKTIIELRTEVTRLRSIGITSAPPPDTPQPIAPQRRCSAGANRALVVMAALIAVIIGVTADYDGVRLRFPGASTTRSKASDPLPHKRDPIIAATATAAMNANGESGESLCRYCGRITRLSTGRSTSQL